jgi:hypothetical protein
MQRKRKHRGNRKREQQNLGLMSGTAPANQSRLSFAGSEDGEAETATVVWQGRAGDHSRYADLKAEAR